MALFSERYGYTKPSDVIIRERITPEIQNAILTCYDKLEKRLYLHGLDEVYFDMERFIWINFLNLRLADYDPDKMPMTSFIESPKHHWFKKLDLIEICIQYLYSKGKDQRIAISADIFVGELSYNFKRLNFAYRIVNKEIVEITSEEEIKEIEKALTTTETTIRTHLNNALVLYSKRPTADYRNSIKESISAVEVFCREKTGEETLGKALNKLESKGIIIHKLLKSAFDKLYAYTNQPDTGVRHALMDNDGDYVPQADEALFMLVSCSAFINYLNKKIKL